MPALREAARTLVRRRDRGATMRPIGRARATVVVALRVRDKAEAGARRVIGEAGPATTPVGGATATQVVPGTARVGPTARAATAALSALTAVVAGATATHRGEAGAAGTGTRAGPDGVTRTRPKVEQVARAASAARVVRHGGGAAVPTGDVTTAGDAPKGAS